MVPEKIFSNKIEKIEEEINNLLNDDIVEEKLKLLSKITNKSKDEVVRSEFIRLSNEKDWVRKTHKVTSNRKTEVPPFIRKILLEVYKGHCQISNYTFITDKGIPYFEVHHINRKKGHHLKNILVVSPNVHAQFTHTNVTHYFDTEDWLRKVKFNEEEFSVRQAIDTVKKEYYKEVHFD